MSCHVNKQHILKTGQVKVKWTIWNGQSWEFHPIGRVSSQNGQYGMNNHGSFIPLWEFHPKMDNMEWTIMGVSSYYHDQ
jgi:hypothetical protein